MVMEENKSERLIEYIAICGVSQGELVNYLTSLNELTLNTGTTQEALRASGLIPKVLSVYPTKEKSNFPLSKNLVDVLMNELSLVLFSIGI